MASDATNENVNILLSKIMTDKYCAREADDFEACIQNFVPQRIDNSFCDLALQRKGLKRCEPYKEVVQKCMQDEKKQSIILKHASKAPTCKDERTKLARCQSSGRGCEQEALDMIFCGLVYLVQKTQNKKPQQGAPSPA